MSQFLGTHQNRLDAKGRISIPAPFRACLPADPGNGPALVLRPSHTHRCIEGWPSAAFRRLAAPLESLEVFSQEYDDLAATLYADAFPMEPDREGRIVLPEPLVRHAGLGDSAVFMGLGRNFQVWEPVAAEQRREEARTRARARGLTLAGQPQASQPQAGDVPPGSQIDIEPKRLSGTPAQ